MKVIHKAQDAIKKLELSMSDDRLKLFAKVEPESEYYNATFEDLVKDITVVTPEDLIDRDVLKDIAKELKEGIEAIDEIPEYDSFEPAPDDL